MVINSNILHNIYGGFNTFYKRFIRALIGIFANYKYF